MTSGSAAWPPPSVGDCARAGIGAAALAQLASPRRCMARGSRSFHFASTLMADAERERLARVYTWCRITDDLVDDPSLGIEAADARLTAWMSASRAAYDGHSTGIAVLDHVMGEMAAHEVPFAYAAALGEGVRSDLRFTPYESMDDVRRYAHRVAGVVGQWLTELYGVRHPWLLGRAAVLGEAMQLTNILRDVGEDWDQGRLYLPRTVLERHGLCAADVGAMRRGERPIGDDYRALVEETMDAAARDYALAREAIPYLPGGFRRAVAIAAAVYEGIHDAIRRNGHDNFRVRARTTMPRKLLLATGALWRVSRAAPSALPGVPA